MYAVFETWWAFLSDSGCLLSRFGSLWVPFLRFGNHLNYLQLQKSTLTISRAKGYLIFRHLFGQLYFIFLVVFSVFLLGCSGSLFWRFGGFWGHFWGSFSVVFLKSLCFFGKRWYHRFWTTLQRFCCFLELRGLPESCKNENTCLRNCVVFLVVKNTTRNVVFTCFLVF